MANVFLAVFVLLTLVLFAPLFGWLPEAVLAAVVINAMWESASPKKVIKLRRDDRVDFALGIATGIMVLATDLLPAMILGIILSVIYLVYRVSSRGRAGLGQDEKTGDFEARHWVSGTRQGQGNPGAREVPGVMLYRFDAPLVFSNAGAFKASGQQILIDTAARGPLPGTLVIDFEEVLCTDASGAESIRGLKRYAPAGARATRRAPFWSLSNPSPGPARPICRPRTGSRPSTTTAHCGARSPSTHRPSSSSAAGRQWPKPTRPRSSRTRRAENDRAWLTNLLDHVPDLAWPECPHGTRLA
jgi:MFS superfamily sulfate permease-like transporter